MSAIFGKHAVPECDHGRAVVIVIAIVPIEHAFHVSRDWMNLWRLFNRLRSSVYFQLFDWTLFIGQGKNASVASVNSAK